MKVLDLFHGTGSATEAFKRLGHSIVSVDLEPECNATVTGDLLDPDTVALVRSLGPFDFVWASPPCERFSVAAIGTNWNRDGTAKNPDALQAERLVHVAIGLCRESRYWVMENPRGMLRTRPVVFGIERRTVTYCRLGDSRMKPTDLWGNFPPGLVLPRPCLNGSSCHEPAPRGSTSGTQGIKGYLARSRVPFALSLLVCLSVQEALSPNQPTLSI